MNKKVVLWSSIVVGCLALLTLLYFWLFTDHFKSGVKMEMELEVRPADVIRLSLEECVQYSLDVEFAKRMDTALHASAKEKESLDAAINIFVDACSDEDLKVLYGKADRAAIKSEISKGVNKSTIGELIMHLTSRCELLGLRNVNIEHVENSNRIRVSLLVNDDSEQVQKTVARIFTASAKLEFWSVANRYDTQHVRAIITKYNMLDGISYRMDDYDHGVLIANRSDIERINELLRTPSNSMLFPYNIKLAWERESVYGGAENEFRLTALDGAVPLMTGDGITEATAQSVDPSRGGGFEVSLTMNSESTRRWANITANHVGQQIAILVDGVVYSAPTVLGRIDGASSITGNFTQEEAENLALTLVTALPVSPRIISFEVIH